MSPTNWISRLNSDGSLDTGFSNPLGESNFSLGALQADGKIILIKNDTTFSNYKIYFST